MSCLESAPRRPQCHSALGNRLSRLLDSCVVAQDPASVRGFLLVRSEGTPLREGLEPAPQLQYAFLIDSSQTCSVAAAGFSPFEPGDLRVLHVAPRSHAQQGLELRIENGHLDILIVQ